MTQTQSWYTELIKPSWAPDPSLFGKVWSILYIMIIIAFAYTCIKTFGNPFGENINPWPKYIFYIFAFNIITNLLFSPIQFWLRNLPLATFDIFLILVSCFALVYYIFPYSKVISLLLVPYTIWVCIATVLQSTITYMNR
jgi:translocator protein